VHPLGYLDRPRHAVALHPARRIDRVPPQVVDELASSDHTGHHGTGIDTDPEPDPVRPGAPAIALAKHRERHVGDGLTVVGARHRDTARDHVGVADRLDLLQPVLVRQPIEGGEHVVEQLHDLLRRQRGRERGELHDVGEEHGRFLEAVRDHLVAALQARGHGPRQHVQQQPLGARVFPVTLADEVLEQQIGHE